MAIATVVTRGFGNGTFNGSIALVTLRGFGIGETPPLWTPATPAGGTWTPDGVSSGIWTPDTPAGGSWTPA